MSQSLSKVYIHCVFSTKDRVPLITDKARHKLHAYIVKILANNGSYVEEIYAEPDHIHILCTLPKTMSTADLLYNIKAPSSKWMKQEGIANFSWQRGYGVFSVSSSAVANVKKYIQNQPEHHKKENFKKELRKFLKEYQIEYNEQYVWD